MRLAIEVNVPELVLTDVEVRTIDLGLRPDLPVCLHGDGRERRDIICHGLRRWTETRRGGHAALGLLRHGS